MNAPYTVYAVILKPGEDPTKVGVDFKKRNGFLFKGKKSLYGKIFLKDDHDQEVQYKIMILKNDFYKLETDNPKYDSEVEASPGEGKSGEIDF
jgi:hypothetical protein